MIADFECPSGHITEHICHWKQKKVVCHCGKKARRIVTPSRAYLGNQNAPWIKSVLEVVDKESQARHVQDFIKNPTRANYKAWMKGEGIKPLDHTEHGGPPVFHKPQEPDMSGMVKEMADKLRDRRRIEVR